HGLALSSSFGWYSLSGILVADKLGPVLGSAAFINDLGRELIAILIIPVLMRRHPSAAIGYGGATALDFTLPVIQKSGGIQVVPVAIVSGFILSLLGPILILGFLAI
ncbi:MAG: lysine exporter LysO family protein, partial [Aeromonas sobria]